MPGLEPITLAREAMATRFEVVLYGDDPGGVRAAGEEALEEIERLHRVLSLYAPTSEIARVNARAAYEAVRVSPQVFRLLEHAQKLHRETGGRFDVTIGPLVRCWGFMGGSGAMPGAAELAEARAKVGMEHVRLDPDEFTVRFDREGVMIDLGAIGKGYAVEAAVNLLREAGVRSAFLHGGTSTAYGLGSPPMGDGWKVAISYPEKNWMTTRAGGTDAANGVRNGDSLSPPLTEGSEVSLSIPSSPPLSPELPLSLTESSEASPRKKLLTLVSLKDEALSVSAVWGKFFQAGDKAFGHVLDPQTGYPVSKAVLAAVVLPSATETDALSTALLAGGIAGHATINNLRPGMRSLVVEPPPGGGEAFEIDSHGLRRPPSSAFSL